MRILVTGASGLIGSRVVSFLQASGYEVVSVDRLANNRFDPQFSITADLLEFNESFSKLSPFMPVDGVVHLAALAHNQAPYAGYDTFSFNVSITRNILRIVEPFNPHFLFASSVTIYGESNRGITISAKDEPHPATEYGRSKLECERILRRSTLSDIEVLRLAPIYSQESLADASKRVFMPGLRRVRMWMIPEPKYSFCHLDHAAGEIAGLIREGRGGRRIRNVCDPEVYGQHQVANWFKGPRILVPTWVGLAFAAMARMVPGALAYRIRCDFLKLFFTHRYDTRSVRF